MTMLAFVGSFPAGSAVVFDYSISPALLGVFERIALQAFSRRVAAVGEPWTLSFAPAELVADLLRIGFTDVEDLGPREINQRYFKNRPDRLAVGSFAHLMAARR
jgi:O-methyltransferase involved in polyketide biosynthesis